MKTRFGSAVVGAVVSSMLFMGCGPDYGADLETDVETLRGRDGKRDGKGRWDDWHDGKGDHGWSGKGKGKGHEHSDCGCRKDERDGKKRDKDGRECTHGQDWKKEKEKDRKSCDAGRDWKDGRDGDCGDKDRHDDKKKACESRRDWNDGRDHDDCGGKYDHREDIEIKVMGQADLSCGGRTCFFIGSKHNRITHVWVKAKGAQAGDMYITVNGESGHTAGYGFEAPKSCRDFGGQAYVTRSRNPQSQYTDTAVVCVDADRHTDLGKLEVQAMADEKCEQISIGDGYARECGQKRY